MYLPSFKSLPVFSAFLYFRQESSNNFPNDTKLQEENALPLHPITQKTSANNFLSFVTKGGDSFIVVEGATQCHYEFQYIKSLPVRSTTTERVGKL